LQGTLYVRHGLGVEYVIHIIGQEILVNTSKINHQAHQQTLSIGQ